MAGISRSHKPGGPCGRSTVIKGGRHRGGGPGHRDAVSQVMSGDCYDICREHGGRMIRPPKGWQWNDKFSSLKVVFKVERTNCLMNWV